METRDVNYKNVRYGMLVELLDSDVYQGGCKVLFYNKKGALVGNPYQFVPFEKLKMRGPDNRKFPRLFYGKRCEVIKTVLFRVVLRLTDIILRATQSVID